MVVKDQSQHDQSCSGHCKQLIWDERSYRNLTGGRAVQDRVRWGSNSIGGGAAVSGGGGLRSPPP